MPSFYSKPSSKQNFFQNYSDHVGAIANKFMYKYYELWDDGDYEALFDLLLEDAMGYLNMFEAIKDAHDYVDSYVGAVAIPALGTVATLASLGKALYEAGTHLFIKLGISKKNRHDYEDHLSNAAGLLAISGLTLALTILACVNSIFSTITRPIATLINGYADQKGERFLSDDERLKRDAGNFLNNLF